MTAGDVDLADCSAASWRSSIAWVPQEPTLFRGTVADNIRLSVPAASDREVRAAAADAGADAFVVELPEGYDTVVGEGGRPLSAGERQRIAIARAFLRDAELVILDEPTANLDPVSAELVGEAIERLRPGRTVLLIVHRPELADARRQGRAPRERPDRRVRGGGGMTATLGRLIAFAGVPARRVAASAVLGMLAVGFGIGLITAAGYLISRAAEQPPILSLTVTIVVRPLLRSRAAARALRGPPRLA